MDFRLVFATAAACVVAATASGQVENASLVGTWDGFNDAYADVWGEGDLAFLAHWGPTSIDVVDISDPANPVGVTYEVPGSGSAQDVKSSGRLVFVGLEGGGVSTHIVDVADPMNPVGLVDICINGMTAVHNVFYSGGYLYLADSGTNRVGIVDLTTLDPDDPPGDDITTVKWMLEDVGDSFVHDVTVVGGRLYASAWDAGVWIYDVTDVATEMPTLLGSGPGNNTHSAWPTADGRYVVTGEERNGGGILAYRIDDDGGDGVTLTVTDEVTLPDEAFSVHNQVCKGYRVYNSWYTAGLRVYDVDPVTGLLSAAATYDTDSTASVWGVYPLLGPDRVLASSTSNGLFIIEVTAPLSPDIVADGRIDVQDLVEVILGWGACDPPAPEPCAADVTCDGRVDVEDLVEVVLNWG